MSSSALRTFAVALIALALLFAALAYVMSRPAPDARDQTDVVASEPERVLAVVAVRTLDPYRAITGEDVALVPIAVEPAQYYRDTADVIGRTPVRRVATGVPVTEEAFGRHSALAEAIPPGTQAISVDVTDVVAVGGFVQPGDFVDVLLYLRASGADVEHSQARVLMRDIRVLAYEDELINSDVAPQQATSGGTRGERTVVLAVENSQTAKLMLAASLGELRLALRAAAANTGDRRGAADTETNTPTRTANPNVITLAELAALGDSPARARGAQSPARRAPAATIEVYEGTKATRIQRP
ncbi:Flp pilus assembly protein CpaB [Salinisphaera sp. S4-8]|uniref:Flp pilus assembly protein CpaB n=1 Tax=Salinisphaera sp. S4-8 TaxID=633357 RepID=UPI00333EB8C2